VKYISQEDALTSDKVTQRARDLIARHAHFSGRADKFEFELIDDVLVIRGCVPTFYLKQLLQDALKHLNSVQQIDNRVDVIVSNGISSVSPR
jgi:hypothetical protein